jgi:hypothetical protein
MGGFKQEGILKGDQRFWSMHVKKQANFPRGD